MKRVKYLQIMLFLVIMVAASFVNLNGQNLEEHSWKNRILLVKTDDGSSEKYQEQIKEFENSAEELSIRKFVLYKILADDFELINFSNADLNDSGKITNKDLKMSMNDKENFEVILIGLDGGIKLRQTEILRKEDLFNIVDAMPMRRNELDRKID